MSTVQPVPGTRAVHILLLALTAVTGAMDATGFLRLGDVFTSVMTGNMVLLGLAVGSSDGVLALHIGVAFAGYVTGVLLGSLIMRGVQQRLLPAAAAVALGVELALIAAFTVLWEFTGGHPSAAPQLTLLAVAAIALGIQSTAVRQLGVPGASTTYMTGTLTDLIAAVGGARRLDGWAAGRLLALIGGAAIGTLLLEVSGRVAPALPLALLVGVLVATLVLRRTLRGAAA